MKTLKLLFGLFLASLLFASCTMEQENNYVDNYNNPVSLEDVVTRYDVWYVDYNRTSGYGDVPFISKAFTLTFQNGRMYANNNIVGIGTTGGGYGIQTGTYNTHNNLLTLNNDIDGTYTFEVITDHSDSIRLYNAYEDVTYYLEGYTSSSFDFDQVFYDNIEYFLQEYDAWAKSFVSDEGDLNDFDYENFLAFTPEDITTFYSSQDELSVPISELLWDFEGDYEVLDINGEDSIKELRLLYRGEENGIVEDFEMVILDDGTIELYHYDSGTTYEFEGYGYIQYRNDGKTTTKASAEQGRKRFKVNRKSTDRRIHKTNLKKKASKQKANSTRGNRK